MPMAWMRAENNQYQPKHLITAFSESMPLLILNGKILKKVIRMKNQLIFKSHTLTPVIINNHPYLETRQLGVALGYTRGDVIGQLYKAHADEFTPEMTCTSDLLVQGQKRKVRVFSLRGCHLLAMFSKTPVAKEFRRWVLNLIEQHNQVVSILETTTLDAKALGGIVKRCTAAAVREELEALTKCNNDATVKLTAMLFENAINDRVQHQLKDKLNKINALLAE